MICFGHHRLADLASRLQACSSASGRTLEQYCCKYDQAFIHARLAHIDCAKATVQRWQQQLGAP